MNCPTCNIPLHITDRQGIEIDYCQKCRGVWLDRGELDKIIERAGPQKAGPHEGVRHNDEDEDYGHTGATHQTARRHERENPLMDIFDFF